MKHRLEDLGRRLERLVLAPDRIEQQTFFRVARPLYALAGWRARVKHVALEELVRRLRDDPDAREKALDAAIAELAETVSTLERVAIMRDRAPYAHAAWARRAWELVVSVSRMSDAEQVRRIGHVDPIPLLPPLTLAVTAKGKITPFEATVPARDADVPEADADARLVELELASIDHLFAAARAERSLLGRRRRLLVAARQRLLEATAALPVERQGADRRSDYVAREIMRIDRLEQAGLAVDVGLVHQARLAVDRGDPRRAYAALAAIDGAAEASGDTRVADLTGRAIKKLWTEGDPRTAESRLGSLDRSARDLLGGDVVREIGEALSAGREAQGSDESSFAARHFETSAERQILCATVAVDGCFEVGGALSPVRVVEEDRVLAQVRHPTSLLVLEPAVQTDDLPDAIIGDPRSVLLDLAAGRLLTRRYVKEVSIPKTRIAMKSEVRVYVVDGSTSMIGSRARIRDGLLVAELATLITRLQSPGTTRCTLFYRYFDENLHAVTRVDGVAAARSAVRDVVGTLREGGTNIQQALVASLTQVQEARELDPDLARAQIVLVTDGEAEVDETAVLEARAAIEGVPVGVSVIALGEENPALRALVAKQRAKGEPAFYHHLSDAQIGAIVDGSLDTGLAVHLPFDDKRNAKALARELQDEIGPLLDELAAIERERDVAAMEQLDLEVSARREAGLVEHADEGARARAEAIARDRQALEARFGRWFPVPTVAPGPAPPREAAEHDDVVAVACALASVAEVVTLLGGTDLSRRADAIEMLERVLPDARVTPARYREVLRGWPGAVAAPLGALHAAVAAARPGVA